MAPDHPNARLTLDLLAWLAARPRSYAETMDAWRTTCPRLAIWEDALAGGLVEVQRGGPMPEAAVTLTPRGRGLLAEAGAEAGAAGATSA